MGSKNNAGKYDCYAKAKDDEPMFILLARDPLAPMIVEEWARWEENRLGHNTEKIQEAKNCANEMRIWRKTNVPSPDPV